MNIPPTVYCVVGDQSGTMRIAMVARELEKRGVTVLFFADGMGMGKKVLRQHGVPFSPRGPDARDTPAAIVIGTSEQANCSQTLWTRWGRAREMPVIWVDNRNASHENQESRVLAPSTICVADQEAAEAVRRTRPDVEIVVTGKPQFEYLSRYVEDRENIRDRVRKNLRVPDEAHLVSYWSGPDPARVSSHVLGVAGMGGADFFFALRFHSKLPADAREELVRNLSADFRHADLDLTHRVDGDELVIASDVVIADWRSPSSYLAPLAGIPTVIPSFPENREERLAFGLLHGEHPAVVTGAAYAPTVARALREFLHRFAALPEAAFGAVEKHRAALAHAIGEDAPARIADVVRKRMKR